MERRLDYEKENPDVGPKETHDTFSKRLNILKAEG